MTSTTLRREAPRPLSACSVHARDGRFHAFAKLSAGCGLVLIFAGALVTSTGSSLSVPDWPLSYGKLLPPMEGGVIFEHGHRLIAGAVSILTWALAIWAWRSKQSALVRWLAAAAAFGIVGQAVLGGITVLMRLPPAVSISHACLGQTVFCLLVAVAQTSSPRFQAAVRRQDGAWKLGSFALLALFVQLALGAYARHTGGPIQYHIAWAAVAATAVLLLVADGLRRRDGWLSTVSAAALGLLALQLSLGYASYLLQLSPDYEPGLHPATATTALHVACGAALLATATVWLLRSLRRPA